VDETNIENGIDNEGVDIEKMQQIQLSHRGSHQEMGYLDREVSRYVNDHASENGDIIATMNGSQ
jgi:hypothetical protein